MLDVATDGVAGRPPRGAFALALWRLPGAPERFAIEASVWTAGAALEWLASIGVLRGVETVDRLAGSVRDAGGATFVPALQGLGTPFQDEAARGALLGLSRGTTAAHLARAALEGVAQRCADLCEAVDLAPGSLPADGGLAASEVLLQTLADLAGRPIVRAAELETTALGAALLAGVAVGHPAAADAAGTGARFEPRLSDAERHAARARWRDAVETARRA
jgi:glycerol kinase